MFWFGRRSRPIIGRFSRGFWGSRPPCSLGLKGNPLLRKPFALPFSNRSLIVPTSAFLEPVKTINADALRADLPILAGAMQKAYSGLDTAARRGWDWNA